MRFSESELTSIAHHLRVAAERYDVDATVMRDQKAIPGTCVETWERLAAQYEQQAKEARKFAARIDAADDEENKDADTSGAAQLHHQFTRVYGANDKF